MKVIQYSDDNEQLVVITLKEYKKILWMAAEYEAILKMQVYEEEPVEEPKVKQKIGFKTD